MSEQAAETEKPKGGGKKLLIIIIAVVLLVVLAGGGAVLYLLTSKPAAEKKAKDGEHGDEEHADEEDDGEKHLPVYEKLDAFTVNLSDGQTYLQVEITLQVKDIKIQEGLKTSMPEVRNEVIRRLSSKGPEELGTLEGKDKLAEEIRTSLNSVLGIKNQNKGVLKVLFNAFIIQ